MGINSQPNQGLEALVGQKVQIETSSGDRWFTDSGTLVSYDYPWVRLKKDNGDVLYFTVYRIRYIKTVL